MSIKNLHYYLRVKFFLIKIIQTGVVFMPNFDFTITGDGSGALAGGIVLIVMLIFLGFGLLFAFGIYLLNAIPLYKIGKKLGYDKNFLPWIPVFSEIIHLFVLSDLPGIKSFSVSPKIDRFLKIGTRKKSFLVYIILYCVGMAVSFIFSGFSEIVSTVLSHITTEYANEGLSAVLYILSAGIDLVSFIIPAIPSLILVVYSITLIYVYLRDLISIFKADRASNERTALIVAVINSVTSGLALPIYLCYLSRFDPLPEEPSEAYDENAVFGFSEEDIGEPPYYPEVNSENNTPEESLTEENTDIFSEDIPVSENEAIEDSKPE